MILDDVMLWRSFPHYLPFVELNQLVVLPHKKHVMRSFDACFMLAWTISRTNSLVDCDFRRHGANVAVGKVGHVRFLTAVKLIIYFSFTVHHPLMYTNRFLLSQKQYQLFRWQYLVFQMYCFETAIKKFFFCATWHFKAKEFSWNANLCEQTVLYLPKWPF